MAVGEGEVVVVSAPVWELEDESVPDCVSVPLPVAVGEGEGEGEVVVVGEPVGELEGESVPDCVSVPLTVAVGDGDAVTLPENDTEGVPDIVMDGVGVGVGPQKRVVMTLLPVSTINVVDSVEECTAPRLPLSWDTSRDPYAAPAAPVPTMEETARPGSAMRRSLWLLVSDT